MKGITYPLEGAKRNVLNVRIERAECVMCVFRAGGILIPYSKRVYVCVLAGPYESLSPDRD